MSGNSHNPTVAVQAHGQSFWYDNIQRSIITNGELQSLIDDYGVLGITSNPAIFDKAISGSSDYDAQMSALLNGAGPAAGTVAIYEALAIEDIQRAADMLEPVYEQSNGLDGYVSLEVSPGLAHDTEGTIQEARRLNKAVARKNLMVKVPATPAGIPAIKQLIADGININVTLIFSLEGYEQVARAFIAGLAERAKKGKPLNIASVASFFVSRVDTLIDKLLDEKIAGAEHPARAQELELLNSKAAIANAKLAYEIFERVFAEPAFAALAAKGARPQRVLWASTSTKNPALEDTYYVEALIGRDTVNTLPPATLKAFHDHGEVAPALHEGLNEAHAQIAALRAAGIDLDAAMEKLQTDGVKLFSDAFDSMLKSIDGKRGALIARGRADNVSAGLGYVDELIKMKAASRLWQRDTALWTTQPEHIKIISNRLGWLSSAQTMLEHVDELLQLRRDVEAMGVTDAVVLGMGGSSLATDVLRSTFGLQEGGLILHVLDTTDPSTITALEKRIDLRRTVFIVASKSGGTLEVSAFYKYFRAKVDSIEPETAGRRFIAVTDEGSSMQLLATEENFGRIFLNPADVGGRYSALSYFGLVPAALQGIDIRQLLERAVRMLEWCKADSAGNPGLWLGGLLGGMALNGRDKVTLVLSPGIHAFGSWLEQLIAESSGKNARGIVPVEGDLQHRGEPLSLKGGVGVLGKDRLFVAITMRGQEAHTEKLIAALKRDGRPLIELTLEDAYDLGAEFFRWAFASAIACVVTGVDPFDEPNVIEGKNNTKRLLEGYETSGAFPNDLPSRSAHGQISKFLRSAKAGEYIAIQAYLPYHDGVDELLTKLRGVIREKVGVPVTVGYGPRFLHSTGQLHKGGANNVVSFQLTYDPAEELLIAGEPYSFATLLRAQALGDLEALLTQGRRAMRIHLGPDVLAGLRKVIKSASGGARRARTTTKPAKAAAKGAE
jgi:transaldolase/glucose-6-phosphate isomerase